MNNFKVTISFDGSGYGGWQIQKNSYTVQQAVEDTLKKILGSRHRVTGCGRTDAGVHANGFVFSFRTESAIPPEGLFRALNSALPESIAVLGAERVPEDFSAQMSALAKRYIYKFSNTVRRSPFADRYALHYEYPLDDGAMDRAARLFTGRHDFTSFCASGAQNLTFERTIFDSRVSRSADDVVFSVTGNGFLYNMVRIMAGTLLYVSEGKICGGSIPDIIASKDRSRAGKTLPARGLYLDRVFYDREFLRQIPRDGPGEARQ